MKKINAETKNIIDYLVFNSLLHLLDINTLERMVKCVEGTDDEPILKSYLRDKKINKILEN